MIVQNMRFFWSTFIISFAGSIGSTLLTQRLLVHRIPIIGSFIGLQPSENPGVAFGLELGVAEPSAIAIAAVIVVVMALRTSQSRMSQTGFGLILGGGMANIIDRFVDGKVTDLFQVGSFPIFNVADSCITVGVAILFLEMFLQRMSQKRQKK